MSHLAQLSASFPTNWTTILVGWDGPGRFPPQLSVDDLDAYATERLLSNPGTAEEALVVKLLALQLRSEGREAIRAHLLPLSDLSQGDLAFEERKWRLVLLKELLNNLPQDTLDGLLALTDFWSDFDFPLDSPHEVQARGENTMTPYEYYTEHNLQRLLNQHRAWIQKEKAALQVQEKKRGKRGHSTF